MLEVQSAVLPAVGTVPFGIYRSPELMPLV